MAGAQQIWSQNDILTTRTNSIEEIFQDARELQADALEMLALGKVRNAAEKAWGAANRATDALVLARTTGKEPGRTPEPGAGPRLLESLDETVREARLLRRYYIRQGSLHGECFCNGLCDPIEDTGAGPARRPAASTMPSAWRQWTSLYAALKGPAPRSWRSCCWTSPGHPEGRPGTRRRS